ncbi:hypothetical protein ACFHW1_04890 [Micromonospora sp. LOL_014]|uniref:hypothetical protein n=1 Tax=Micromonospora sp. LOL_014 TaxID=3345415 RepID=UPI003A8C3E41
MPTPPRRGDDPLAVKITGREIYDAVVRLTGRVDVLIEQQTAVRADLADHEERIRTVERRLWPLPTVSVLIAVAALAVGLLPRLTS